MGVIVVVVEVVVLMIGVEIMVEVEQAGVEERLLAVVWVDVVVEIVVVMEEEEWKGRNSYDGGR